MVGEEVRYSATGGPYAAARGAEVANRHHHGGEHIRKLAHCLPATRGEVEEEVP